MFLLGLLSFFQMTLVPGYILLRLLKVDIKGAIQGVVYSFALSLLINYLLVYLLTAFHFYKVNVIYTILSIEYLYLGYLVFRDMSGTKVLKIINLPKAVYDILKAESSINGIITVLSIYVIFRYCEYFVSSLGQVFGTWDALFSWNRWAIDWYHNRLPSSTMHYPQLIPVNWSLTYKILQTTDVQMFAKALMPLFPLATLLIFLDLAISKKEVIGNTATRVMNINFTYLIGLVAYGLFVLWLYSPYDSNGYAPGYLTDGYVDTAVTFFAFLTFYCLLQRHEMSAIDIKSLLLSITFGSAAAIIKQAGLFFLFASLVYSAWYLLKNKKRLPLSNKQVVGVLLLVGLIIFTVVLSWYVPKEIQISRGLDSSEISHVTNDIHGGKSYVARVIDGALLLPRAFVIMTALLLILSLFDSSARWLSLGVTLPYIAFWALFFSYDIRNFLPALPFIAYSAAFSITNLLKIFFSGSTIKEVNQPAWTEKLYFSLAKTKLAYGLIALLLTIAALSFTKYDSRFLIAQQINLQKQLKNSELNGELYKYDKKHQINGRIVTDYGFLAHLPEFRDHTESDVVYYNTPSVAGYKNISYLLISDTLNSSITTEIDAGLKSGRYKLIFHSSGYKFIKART